MVIRRGLARGLSKERHLLPRLTTQVQSQGSTEWSRELTPMGCVLISICVPWHWHPPTPHIHPAHTHTYVHMHTRVHAITQTQTQIHTHACKKLSFQEILKVVNQYLKEMISYSCQGKILSAGCIHPLSRGFPGKAERIS